MGTGDSQHIPLKVFIVSSNSKSVCKHSEVN